MSNNITGNKTSSFTLMSVLMALKDNIARDFHVADVCKIIEKKNDGYYVSLYNDTSVKFQCKTVIDTDLNKDDVVLVVYTNSNFKNKDAIPLHSRNNAVIVSQTGGGGSAIEVIDNLLSNSPSAALSANQGRILKGLIDTLNSNLSNTNNLITTLETKKADKSEIPDVSQFVTKAVNDLVNYYTKSQTYSQEEINQRLSAIPKFSIEVVSTLPTENISTTTVYLVPSGSESQNLYVEYIYINDTWEKLGEQTIDLSNYPTIEEMNIAIANYLANYYTSEQVDNLISTKKTVYFGTCDTYYNTNTSVGIATVENFPYTSIDDIPSGTTIQIKFTYSSTDVDGFIYLNVNGIGDVVIKVTNSPDEHNYLKGSVGGWESNDVLTFSWSIDSKAWVLTQVGGRIIIQKVISSQIAQQAFEDGYGNHIKVTDYAKISDIPTQYLKDATVTSNTLTITKQDGSTVDFQGGSGITFHLMWEVWE